MALQLPLTTFLETLRRKSGSLMKSPVRENLQSQKRYVKFSVHFFFSQNSFSENEPRTHPRNHLNTCCTKNSNQQNQKSGVSCTQQTIVRTKTSNRKQKIIVRKENCRKKRKETKEAQRKKKERREEKSKFCFIFEVKPFK